MTEQELRQTLRRSLTDELPMATRRAVLTRVRERKKPVMRSKFSIALIIMIVLMLLSTVALAVTLSREYFEDVAQLQFESGYYEDWGFEEKKMMVDILREYGLISEEQSKLLDTEAEIDALMIERYGVEGSNRMDTIGLYSILEIELGLIETWSLEQRAWYSDMMMRTGLLKKGGEEGIFGIPEMNDVQPEEAISIAKAAIIDAFGLPEGALDNHRIELSFETDSNDWERNNLHYIINFWGDEYYWCNITRDGRIMDSTMDSFSRSPSEQFEQKRKEEEKAKVAEVLRPHGAADLWSLEDKMQYLGENNGIPSEGDISEAKAVEIAKQRLKDIGYELAGYEVSVWYKIYDDPYNAAPVTDQPFYVIYFIDDLEAPFNVFSVAIDAASGEILNTFTPKTMPQNG